MNPLLSVVGVYPSGGTRLVHSSAEPCFLPRLDLCRVEAIANMIPCSSFSIRNYNVRTTKACYA